MGMFCVNILYKLFQLFMRIKSNKKITKILPVNGATKNLWTIRKPLFFKMIKKCIGWSRSLGLPWENHLIGNNIRYQSLSLKSFIQFSKGTSSGKQAKRLSTSKLAMIQLASKLTTSSSVNKNEPWTLNSSTGNGEKIRIKNFPRLYVCFLIVDTMEGKERKL